MFKFDPLYDTFMHNVDMLTETLFIKYIQPFPINVFTYAGPSIDIMNIMAFVVLNIFQEKLWDVDTF